MYKNVCIYIYVCVCVTLGFEEPWMKGVDHRSYLKKIIERVNFINKGCNIVLRPS